MRAYAERLKLQQGRQTDDYGTMKMDKSKPLNHKLQHGNQLVDWHDLVYAHALPASAEMDHNTRSNWNMLDSLSVQRYPLAVSMHQCQTSSEKIMLLCT